MSSQEPPIVPQPKMSVDAMRLVCGIICIFTSSLFSCCAAYCEAFAILAAVVRNDDIHLRLIGKPIQPVFRGSEGHLKSRHLQ